MADIPDKNTFASLYSGQAPWDIGKPQKAFLDVADQITGSILDAGCGTGDNALYLASQGHKVTGIDFLEDRPRHLRSLGLDPGNSFHAADPGCRVDRPGPCADGFHDAAVRDGRQRNAGSVEPDAEAGQGAVLPDRSSGRPAVQLACRRGTRDPYRRPAALRQDNDRLNRDLSRQQALVRLAQRTVGLPPLAPPCDTASGGWGRRGEI